MASIGGFIWDDADADGIQDSGEFGLDGRLIYLLDANGLFLASTATVDGTFVFSDLDAGDYLLYVVASEGTVFTSRDHGSDDSIDSDCNPTGISDVITLGAGEVDLSFGGRYLLIRITTRRSYRLGS